MYTSVIRSPGAGQKNPVCRRLSSRRGRGAPGLPNPLTKLVSRQVAASGPGVKAEGVGLAAS